ncbi:galactitol-1-phosphate 5-dehydrogenase [Paenibacillus baekrokdamisoli]|uniref:Galactitol-1-phosphate 5-dehydrogenase n=1 Tax=Paenibacillus baekrokdamisoli TaxID=1712516 RepID=A0A3G9ILD1_9BACL|nr:zinc-binding dehydrogenase [Paenibacillus baekrokdamisoli]MBB3067071.1 2-desacetyl-2-hydroxyethyl bacteriochlorophyllide A dehydrogenase [Paenibacillus baekrokdamisoli]BBH19737.1 galactitol-1-phosphate 5-dehydrogenase [Paenibacillus baekrokdamisoli]
MNTLVWTAVEEMSWEHRDAPHLQEDEVLIQVEVVGICGSEIEGYLGHNSLRIPPLIMGHEFCGRIAQLGTGIAEDSGIKLGVKVVVNPLLFCGKCLSCEKGLTQLCEKRAVIGIHRPGAFSEWVAVPASAVVVLPDTISSFRAALAEPLACSVRATRRALEHHPMANVVVFGAGGIGLLCAKMARILGADQIIVVDTNPERLQIAMANGVNAVINPKEEDIGARIKSMAGRKGVNVVIDAAGFQPTRETAVMLLNPGGTLMNIGLGIDATSLPINYTIRSEIEIKGSFSYTKQDFQDAVNLLIDGKITEAGWTEVRPMSEGGHAFAELVAGKVMNGKIFLTLSEGVF